MDNAGVFQLVHRSNISNNQLRFASIFPNVLIVYNISVGHRRNVLALGDVQPINILIKSKKNVNKMVTVLKVITSPVGSKNAGYFLIAPKINTSINTWIHVLEFQPAMLETTLIHI